VRELEDLALAFDRACRTAGVEYAYVGGIAVIAWGQPRTTMDVDALVRLVASKTAALESAAKERDTVREGLARGFRPTSSR
jgi:hypothetical protein